MEMLLQAIVVILAIFMGARYKGIGLGIWGGAGLIVLMWAFGVKPTSPPVDVILITIAVVTAASVMYAAGGLDYMVSIAEKIIRANPKRITIVAPLTTWFFSALAGTAHIMYPLMPVIYEVAYSQGIRPERPMAVSCIAAQQAITASPVSAATAAMLGMLVAAKCDATLGQILMITVPSSLFGVIIAALIQMHVGKELADDPEFQERLRQGLVVAPKKREHIEVTRNAKLSTYIFILGVVIVVLSGFFPALRTPLGADKAVGMAMFLQIFMLATASVILVVTKANLSTAISSPIMKAGLTAAIAIFGLAWMGDSFISAHKAVWIESTEGLMESYPWIFAGFLCFMAIVLNSQAATVRAVMPLGLALGLSPQTLLGMFPAVDCVFFFPTSGPLVGTVSFDLSGTTKIGKYVLNHSFMLPGWVATISAIIAGLTLVQFVDFGW